MGNFYGWLLCCDVDGTLIDDKQVISQENKDAINYFKKGGGLFTYATGRHYLNITDRISDIMADIPIVTANGCSIFDVKKMKYSELLTLEGDYKSVVTYVEKEFPFSGIEIVRPEDVVFYRENNATTRHYQAEKLNRTTKCSNLGKIEGPWFKILLAQEPEQTDYIVSTMEKSNLSDKYKLVKSHEFYFEILNIKANKGSALKKICDNCSIPQNKVIAIGDNSNDLEMLEFAEISAAPANAGKDVLNAANIITKNNNDSAIADLVNKLDKIL